jgi:hypothetical protein
MSFGFSSFFWATFLFFSLLWFFKYIVISIMFECLGEERKPKRERKRAGGKFLGGDQKRGLVFGWLTGSRKVGEMLAGWALRGFNRVLHVRGNYKVIKYLGKKYNIYITNV